LLKLDSDVGERMLHRLFAPARIDAWFERDGVTVAETKEWFAVPFATIEDAIRVANDTEYGLSSAVFGRDVNRALNVARQIESGICHINGPTVQDEAQTPFGGMKASGYGRFNGHAAINEFTELRWITIETEPHHYPF